MYGVYKNTKNKKKKVGKNLHVCLVSDVFSVGRHKPGVQYKTVGN